MTEVLHARFNSDVDGFSAGTWTSGQGSAYIGDSDGALTVGAGVTSYRDFTSITSGVVRVDFCVKESNSTLSINASTIFYLLPNGTAVLSANTCGCVLLDRGSGSGATSSAARFSLRDSTGFVYTQMFNLPKGPWYKLSVVSYIATKTFDVLLDDIVMVKGRAWANSGASGIGRVAISGNSSAPDCYVDNVRVEDSYSLGESVLVEHDFVGGSGEIEASTPTTSARDAHAQPWLIPTDTSTYGGFTLGSDGATPDSATLCLALQRCAVDGTIECEFKTPPTGTAYFGIQFRFWDYPTSTGAGAGILRVFGGASNTINLFLADRSGSQVQVQTASLTPAADTIYTLKLEMRGRVLIASYKAAAMDSGSYTTAYTHTVISSATGGRGMLSEELAGPFVATSLGSAIVRKFRFTGKAEASEAARTIGAWKYGMGHGSVREAYYLDSAAATRNMFWSKGIQYGHRSSADMCGFQQQAAIYDSTNVYAVRQTGGNVTEYQHLGTADCYVTLLHRGPWISDGILPRDTSENFAPDFDLLPSAWASSFLTAINSGSATSRNDSPYHDWTAHNSLQTLPAGNQSLTAYGSGQEAHVSQVVIADGTVPTSAWDVTSKLEGNGDPISRAISTQGTHLSAGTSIRVARAFLMRPASALDGATLTAWRDDLASPATLTFTTGSAKTDAAGDTGATGFNRRHGWYEITCSGGDAEWTLPVASGTRFMPVFRLHGYGGGSPTVTINAVSATAGVDYVADEVESGVLLVQFLGDYTADVDFAVAVSAPSDTTGPSAPGTPTFSAITKTAATVSYIVATDDTAVTGYEYRLDGGSVVDVGNVLTFGMTGQTPGDTVTVEVRAYDAAGNRGAWASADVTFLIFGIDFDDPALDLEVGNVSGSLVDLGMLASTSVRVTIQDPDTSAVVHEATVATSAAGVLPRVEHASLDGEAYLVVLQTTEVDPMDRSVASIIMEATAP